MYTVRSFASLLYITKYFLKMFWNRERQWNSSRFYIAQLSSAQRAGIGGYGLQAWKYVFAYNGLGGLATFMLFLVIFWFQKTRNK